MNVRITFRHMDSSEAVKAHAKQKLTKLQKFLREPMTAKVTLSLDKLAHVAETHIQSGGSRHEAKETSDDMYTSIDKVMAKLERQIRGDKGVKQAKKKRSGKTLRGGKEPAIVPVATPVAPSAKKAAKKKPIAAPSKAPKKKTPSR
jgi:putative sigma-54 modulation protein